MLTEKDLIFNFKRLNAYQQAKILVKDVYKLLSKFPKEEQYALCDQLRRASVSITSNIAEGTNRSTLPDKIHFIEIAYGSLMEVESQLDISNEIGYINDLELQSIENQIVIVAKLLSGLRASYKNSLCGTSKP